MQLPLELQVCESGPVMSESLVNYRVAEIPCSFIQAYLIISVRGYTIVPTEPLIST